MSLGPTPVQGDVSRDTTEFCALRVRTDSIYALLHRECFTLFPDELFADLFADIGRRSVPPLVVAVVMVLQHLEGLSDREAVERSTFDARWKYACGGLGPAVSADSPDRVRRLPPLQPEWAQWPNL